MIENKIQQDINLEQMTTFKIGGKARYFVEVESENDLVEALAWSKKKSVPYFILGGGSNILANDKGVEGLVIHMSNYGIEARGDVIECGAGALLAKAMITANGNGLGGLEWAIGIPGTVGGAIRGNAGAFGYNIGNSVESVEIYHTTRGHFEKISQKDCSFGYRHSIFKDDKSAIIWKVILKLDPKSDADIKNTVAGYLEYREKSQPRLPSAGSFFKNISLDALREANKSMAELAVQSGVVKNNFVGAGWIIDFLGFKGKAMGGAKVSLEHANFIVNTGKATTEDVIMLSSYIKQQARSKLGIQLFEEVQYFGI